MDLVIAAGFTSEYHALVAALNWPTCWAYWREHFTLNYGVLVRFVFDLVGYYRFYPRNRIHWSTIHKHHTGGDHKTYQTLWMNESRVDVQGDMGILQQTTPVATRHKFCGERNYIQYSRKTDGRLRWVLCTHCREFVHHHSYYFVALPKELMGGPYDSGG